MSQRLSFLMRSNKRLILSLKIQGVSYGLKTAPARAGGGGSSQREAGPSCPPRASGAAPAARAAAGGPGSGWMRLERPGLVGRVPAQGRG